MKTIYKYPLPLAPNEYGSCEIIMPAHSKILSTMNQNGSICVWAEVNDTEVLRETRVINVFGTGLPLDKNPGTFLGTVQIGVFFWHVYVQI